MRVSAVSEPLPGRDEQLGQIFINMRRAMNVSRETIARRLATRAQTIDDFEAGAVTALPHWKETERIVRGYCELLRLDPEPILWRIRSHLDSLPPGGRRCRLPGHRCAGRAVRPNGMPRGVRTSERAKTAADDRTGQRRRRRMRTLFTLTAPVALAGGHRLFRPRGTRLVYPVIAMLPDRLEIPVRAGLEYMVLLTAPSRDGLRWIEVGDPQLRKADKLQTDIALAIAD